jgi:hypothetical protein
MKDATLGSDIESFVTSEGNLIPVCGTVGGTKQAPKPLGIGFIQEDNVCAEFNIPVAHTPQEFAEYIREMVYATHNALIPFGYRLYHSSFATFPADVLDRFPGTKVFGCDPDINAYLREYNPPPMSREGLRSAGFHLHIGHPRLVLDPNLGFSLVKALDLTIGVPSLAFDPALPRRTLYGLAGSFRFKPYGIEWRVPGSEWLNYPNLWELMATTALETLAWVLDEPRAIEIIERHENSVLEAINTGNKELVQVNEDYPCLSIA